MQEQHSIELQHRHIGPHVDAHWGIERPALAEDLHKALVQSFAVAPGATLVLYASAHELRPFEASASRTRTLDLPVVSPVGSPRVATGDGVASDPLVRLPAPDDGKATKEKESPCWCSYGFTEMTPATRKFYDDLIVQRAQLADLEQAETEQINWTLGANLRVVWGCAQRSDKDLNGYFRHGATFPHDVRLAEDGVLEHLAPDRSPEKPEWVPIVPAGYATSHLTWKQWVFLQMHIGIFGHHRAGKKTYQLMDDVVWWAT